MGRAGHNFSFEHGGGELHFQDGPVKENGKNGVQAPEVLRAVYDYLFSLNVPPYGTRETSLALTKIQEAVHWLDARTSERENRGVEGTDEV